MSYYRDFIEDLNQFEKDSFPYSLIPGSTGSALDELLGMPYGDMRQQVLQTDITKNHATNAYMAHVKWVKDDGSTVMLASCRHLHPTKLQNKRTASKHVSIASAENCAKAMVEQIRNVLPPNGWMGIQEGLMPPHHTSQFAELQNYTYAWEPSSLLHTKIKDTYTYDTKYTEAINKYAIYWTDEVQKLFATEEPAKEQIQYRITPVMLDGRRMFVIVDPDDEPVTDPVAHRGEIFAMCRELNEKENS